jgi:hypothetical protein
MRQPALPNRKRPEFRCCPVCEVEFWVRHRDQRWCSVNCANRAKRGVNAMFREMKRAWKQGMVNQDENMAARNTKRLHPEMKRQIAK